MEEMIVLPKKELPEIVRWYKGELTSIALLNRAGHLAAKKKRLLTDPGLDATQAVQQTQPLSRALRETTKRLRQLPGAEGPGGGGVAVDEEEEDENLVSTALEKWMKRMVQSGLKREPKTPRQPPPSPPPPPPVTARPALKRPAATSSTVPKWISKSGREWHWPGYQYMGPGTHLKKRLKQGDPVINRLERIAKQHDIDYTRAKTLKDKYVADRKMIRAIGHLPGRKTLTEHVVKKIMQAKTRLNL